LSLGLFMYAQDYDETFPPPFYTNKAATPPGGFWFPDTWFWPQIAESYTKNYGIYKCPSGLDATNEFNMPHALYIGNYGANHNILNRTTPAAMAAITQPASTFLVFDSGAYQSSSFLLSGNV